MKNKSLQIVLVVAFVIVGIIILKIFFNTPDLAIAALVGLSLVAGTTFGILIRFANPSDWIFRIRKAISGVVSGVFLGVVLFSMDSIEENTFIIGDLLKYVLIGAVIGGFFINTSFFSHFKKRNKRKGLFLLERQLINDFANVTTADGQKIEGRLILTTNNLIFCNKNNNERFFEVGLTEINPFIENSFFQTVIKGVKWDNSPIRIRVPFPAYWLKRINKRKMLLIHTEQLA